MLDELRAHFAANAGIQTQLGASPAFYRTRAPKNAGNGANKKYVTYTPTNDPNPPLVSAVSTTKRNHRVEFRCHALGVENCLDVYNAVKAVIVGQFRGTWGTVTIQSALWDGDSYEETPDPQTDEIVISITLVVTWNT
jgi:hypothetical protein